MGLPEAPDDAYYLEPSEPPANPFTTEPATTPTPDQLSFLEHFTKTESKALQLAVSELKGG
jgi:hypothetical protein